MKILYAVTLLYIITNCQVVYGEEEVSPLKARPPKPDEVLIAGTGLNMVLGRYILVRRGVEYCAVKFTDAWYGETDEDRYANYESHYQADGTGDITKENVKVTKEQLVRRRYWGIGKLSFPVGRQNLDVKCGPIRMAWLGKGSLHFFAEGESDVAQGIELAPTKWKELSEVNVFDPRLKWYKHDQKKRTLTYIHIDQLWEDKEDKK